MVDTKTAINVSQWLIWHDQIKSATPVIVQIAKRQFVGARYSEACEGTVQDCLYVLGELPVLHRRSRICFRTADSERDWHLTSWYRRIAGTVEYDELHIFGSHLILTLYSELNSWAHTQCDPKLRRLKMTITEIGPTSYNVQQPSEDGQ
jgi:hypothetical protein